MKLYCELIQKNANILDIFIPDKKTHDAFFYCSKNITNMNIVQTFIFMHVLHMNVKRELIFTSGGVNYSIYVKEKYINIKNTLNNVFTSEKDKDIIFDIFSKTQRTILALNKFLYIYRFKKAKVKISMDLCMNEISPQQKNVFTLFQNKFKYYFIASDLINIINRCLMNSSNFFSEPLRSKNPYNNMEFIEADLYNIYFFFKSRLSVVPQLIQNFFLCRMNLNLFKAECECLIRELYIYNYIYTTHSSVLYPTIDDMFELSREWTRYLKIHEDFPKDKLVEIMRPYLHLYYIHLFYIEGTSKKENSYYILKKKLRHFVKFNPQFGRKKITIFKEGTNTVEFNDECIQFHKEYQESELKSINISLRNPFDPPSRRSHTYLSPPVEQRVRQPRVVRDNRIFSEDTLLTSTFTLSSNAATEFMDFMRISQEADRNFGDNSIVQDIRQHINHIEPTTPVETPPQTPPMSPPRIGMGNNFISLFRTQEPPYSFTNVQWTSAISQYSLQEEDAEEETVVETANEYLEYGNNSNIYSTDSDTDDDYDDENTLF